MSGLGSSESLLRAGLSDNRWGEHLMLSVDDNGPAPCWYGRCPGYYISRLRREDFFPTIPFIAIKTQEFLKGVSG